MFDQFLIVLQRTVELGLLAALPFWLRYAFSAFMHNHDGIGYYAVPGLARLSFFSGVIFGGALLYVSHPADLYYFDTVFAEGGPWDVSLLEFFITRLDPRDYPPAVLWERVWPLKIGDTLTGFVLTSAVLAAVTTAAAVFYFRRNFHLALLRNLAVWLWSATLAVYAVCAAAWALNMLNFWAVVLMFLLVRYRSLASH